MERNIFSRQYAETIENSKQKRKLDTPHILYKNQRLTQNGS